MFLIIWSKYGTNVIKIQLYKGKVARKSTKTLIFRAEQGATWYKYNTVQVRSVATWRYSRYFSTSFII